MTGPSERLVDQPDDDLTLLPFLQTLWSYRRVMAVALAAIVLAYAVMILIVYARQPREHVASLGFRLIFEGAAQEQFPNGTKFSSTEIISTPVLAAVYQKNDLNRYGTFDALKDSVYVLQANPNLELLSYEYQTKLSDSRIGPVERTKLEEEFRKKREALKSVQFSLNMRRTERLLQMPNDLMSKILQDTLATWAEQAATRKGAVRYDIPVLSRNFLQKDLLTSEDYVVAADILRSTIERILTSVDNIGKIPGSDAVRAGEQQTSLADVRASLEDLLRFRVQPLIGEIRVARISRHASRMDLYFEGRLFEAQAALDETQQRVVSMQEALATYQRKPAAAGLTSGDGDRGSVTPQLSESFIDRLVDITSQSNDVSYRQDLTNKIIETGLQTANMKKQVAYYQAMQKAFGGAASGTSNARLEADISGRIGAVYAQIGTLLDQVQVLYRLIAEQNLNPNTVLYTVTTPFVATTTAALTIRAVLLYFVITVLISLIVIQTACLIHSYFRRRVTPAKYEHTSHPSAG